MALQKVRVLLCVLLCAYPVMSSWSAPSSASASDSRHSFSTSPGSHYGGRYPSCWPFDDARMSNYWTPGRGVYIAQQNRGIILSVCAAYIPLVFLGLKFMKSREPLPLKIPCIIWNLTLSLLSFFGISLIMMDDWKMGLSGWYPERHYLPRTRAAITGFALSKILEFGDTALLILRKRPVCFLHVYHHITVALYCWHAQKVNVSFAHHFGIINLVIHGFMYLYYACNGILPRNKVLRCVRPYITGAQLLQMFVGISISVRFLASSSTSTTVPPLSLLKETSVAVVTGLMASLSSVAPQVAGIIDVICMLASRTLAIITFLLARLMAQPPSISRPFTVARSGSVLDIATSFDEERVNAVIAFCMYTSYAYLFGNFYIKHYIKKLRPNITLFLATVHVLALVGLWRAWQTQTLSRVCMETVSVCVVTYGLLHLSTARYAAAAARDPPPPHFVLTMVNCLVAWAIDARDAQWACQRAVAAAEDEGPAMSKSVPWAGAGESPPKSAGSPAPGTPASTAAHSEDTASPRDEPTDKFPRPTRPPAAAAFAGTVSGSSVHSFSAVPSSASSFSSASSWGHHYAGQGAPACNRSLVSWLVFQPASLPASCVADSSASPNSIFPSLAPSASASPKLAGSFASCVAPSGSPPSSFRLPPSTVASAILWGALSFALPVLYGMHAYGDPLLGALAHGCLRWVVELHTVANALVNDLLPPRDARALTQTPAPSQHQQPKAAVNHKHSNADRRPV
eukprot:GHVT01018808.1.p1 GENE.GHVT01018808.1~~GHVT01018808.1.p1  ORF type:complete len:741 (-),score=91.40 GHVT01018808.1:1322-3544(-)